jgi:hypothetical protein
VGVDSQLHCSSDSRAGFTRKLVEHVKEERTTSIQCYLDGPYGIAESYSHHDCVVLIAGEAEIHDQLNPAV